MRTSLTSSPQQGTTIEYGGDRAGSSLSSMGWTATACRLCGSWCTRPESESDSGSEAGLVLSVRDVCSRGSHFKPLVGLPGDISLMRSSCSERCDAVWSRPCGRSHAWISLVRCDLIFILLERLLLWMLFFLPLLLSHSPSEQASKACQFQFSIYSEISSKNEGTLQCFRPVITRSYNIYLIGDFLSVYLPISVWLSVFVFASSYMLM